MNYESRTPVQGARLVVAASPDTNLYLGAEPYNNASISINTAISNSSDGSIEITGSRSQGIITYPFSIRNFDNLQIQFDIYLPATTIAAQAGPYFGLINSQGLLIELSPPQLFANQWQTIILNSSLANYEIEGTYQLITVVINSTPLTWYMDNLSINQEIY
jgi:hypothetical protein